MKKSKPLLILLVILGINLLHGCINHFEGKYGISCCYEQSLERGVVKKLLFEDTLIVINDTLSLPVKHCWIDHDWIYGRNWEDTEIQDEGENLIIELEDNNHMKNYMATWSITHQDNRGKNHRSFGFGKVGDYSIYLRDPNELESLNFYVVTGSTLIRDSIDLEKRKIGEFNLSIEMLLDKVK